MIIIWEYLKPYNYVLTWLFGKRNTKVSISFYELYGLIQTNYMV